MGSLLMYDINKFIGEHQLSSFIETGTLYGEAIEHVQKTSIENIVSIEIEEDLAEKARQKFLGDPRVKIITGDSSVKITEALQHANSPCLFWLDAHFPGGDRNDEKRRGYLEESNDSTRVPLLKEIEEISKFKYFKESVFIIDDARLFEEDNPNLDNHLQNIGQNELTRALLCPYNSETVLSILQPTHEITRIHAYGEGNYIAIPRDND